MRFFRQAGSGGRRAGANKYVDRARATRSVCVGLTARHMTLLGR